MSKKFNAHIITSIIVVFILLVIIGSKYFIDWLVLNDASEYFFVPAGIFWIIVGYICIYKSFTGGK